LASHPYISGPGNVTQMIEYLRKNFPATVTAETVKKFGIASNNESYVINALQFIGVLDEDSKRTEKAHSIFVLGPDQFPNAFSELIKTAYTDLFELRGDDAWTLSRTDLVNYFRSTDKTSDVIGGRQAGLFQAFCALAGYAPEKSKAVATTPPKTRSKPNPKSANSAENSSTAKANAAPNKHAVSVSPPHKGMSMTVRLEINLPSNGTKETYDAIFKSIRANLIDD
jgi:hypothetical protein